MLLRSAITGMLLAVSLPYPAKVSAQQQVSAKGAVCSVKEEGLTLTWNQVKTPAILRLPARYGSVTLPKTFSVYIVNEKSLQRYLAMAGKRGNTPTTIHLPSLSDQECIRFKVISSGTLSPELAAKFPGLVSLKGLGIDDISASVRIDYDGKVMNAEIRQQDRYYIIAPWKKGNKTYYVVYRKEDATTKRSTPAGR
ncbi:hypothetical protein [Taibaiella helva]|uniref:hypothetical protein n=1 Tax=Taibaiella helva TaxID=2301235 RepID=UPI0018E570A8|nr:hypothetical protein [Taibaiella helva]